MNVVFVDGPSSVTARYGIRTWDLEPDRGPRTARLRDRSDVRSLPGGRILLTDVHRVKYEIPSLAALDEHSRTLLEAEI